MKYDYFKFGKDIARLEKDKGCTYSKEFYRNGQWVKDEKRNKDLTDAMMNYGDYSVDDFDQLSEEEAMEYIRELK